MVLGLNPDASKWILVYFPVSWLTQFGHGLVTTVLGPTQPYLAKQVFLGINLDLQLEAKIFRWVSPIIRSASYGPAEPLVIAQRRSSPALSSGLVGWGC